MSFPAPHLALSSSIYTFFPFLFLKINHTSCAMSGGNPLTFGPLICIHSSSSSFVAFCRCLSLSLSLPARNKPLNIRVLDPQDGSLLSSEGFCAAMRVRLERRKDGTPVIFPTPAPASDETGKAVITADTISKGRASASADVGSKTRRKGKGKATRAKKGGDEWSGGDDTDDPYGFLTTFMMDVLEAGWSDVTKVSHGRNKQTNPP